MKYSLISANVLLASIVVYFAYVHFRESTPHPISAAFQKKYPIDDKMNSAFCQSDGSQKSEEECLIVYTKRMQRAVIQHYAKMIRNDQLNKIENVCRALNKSSDRACFVPSDFEGVIRGIAEL